jgi:hypothetical protein
MSMPGSASNVTITWGDFSHGNRANGVDDDYYGQVADAMERAAARASQTPARKPAPVDRRVTEFLQFANKVDYGTFIGRRSVARGCFSTATYPERVAFIVEKLQDLFKQYTLPVLDLFAKKEVKNKEGDPLRVPRVSRQALDLLSRDPIALVVLMLAKQAEGYRQFPHSQEKVIRADARKVRATRPAALVELIESKVIPFIAKVNTWYFRDLRVQQLEKPSFHAGSYFSLAESEPKAIMCKWVAAKSTPSSS